MANFKKIQATCKVLVFYNMKGTRIGLFMVKKAVVHTTNPILTFNTAQHEPARVPCVKVFFIENIQNKT